MNAIKLRNIQKFSFGYAELARVLGIGQASARVTASRYVKMGLLVRVKRNVYVLKEVWDTATRKDKFILSNLGQTPSYISLMTALDYYDTTTQMQQDFFESVAIQRTKTISVAQTVFRYAKIAPELYFGFEKQDGFFIASPEKALIDAAYLISYGRYALDFSAIDTGKINRRIIEKLSRSYPQRTRSLLRNHGYLSAA